MTLPEQITGVWQKWRFSAPQIVLWLNKVWFSASTFVMKIATFAKRQTVTQHLKKSEMKRIFIGLIVSVIYLTTLQSCSKEEDSYFDLTEEAKELILYDAGDTFELKNIETNEIITLTVNWSKFDYSKDGGTPGSIYSGLSGDNYYERGEYSFSDQTDCYNGTVAVEARGNGNFEFSIFTGDCFGEYLTTFEFNSLGFDYGGETASININGTEYSATYVLNSQNNTIFYTKENGIIQIFDEVDESAKFTIE